LNCTAFSIGQRFVGLTEVSGPASNPLILAMLRLDVATVAGDDVPWCSAWLNWIAWLLRLPRSKSLAARSWLNVGEPIELHEATVGNDVVILKRGTGDQPGPEVLNAPGHVGLFAGAEFDDRGIAHEVLLLAGNQGNQVSIAHWPASLILGLRRLA
jgi:uncharacterized protein (TIGR02594 family)